MHRWKLWLFGSLAGTGAAIAYAGAVAPGAKTKLNLAILIFTTAAAVTGFLGLVVAWLGYRLEAGRIPRPDLAIVAGGELVRKWEIEIDVLDPAAGLEAAVKQERARMEGVIDKLRPAKGPITPATAALISSSFMFREVSEQDIADYRKEVAEYLSEYATFLKHRRAIEVLRARSAQLVLAFTNERAGVPAEGVRAVIRFPTDDGFRVWNPSDIPEPPDAPEPPTPPRPRSLLDHPPISLPTLLNLPALDRSLGSLRDVQPQGNVSPPTIREGSTIVEFSVTEVLHNLHEDTREHPLVLQFNRAGTWTVPYEVHARNLPQPKTGTVTLVVSVREGN